MGISIVGLERDQYFVVRDRQAKECLENAYSLADGLTVHGNRKSRSQERITCKLKDNFSNVIGHRRAEDVTKLDYETCLMPWSIPAVLKFPPKRRSTLVECPTKSYDFSLDILL